MSTWAFDMNPDDFLIDGGAARKLGARLHDGYIAATPYPHVCIDVAFPTSVLDRIEAEVRVAEGEGTSFANFFENRKSQRIPERLPFYSRSFCYTLNSRPFLAFLEELTGIKGLIPDPYFIGGGLHEVGNGGHLSIHADFNYHKPLNLERRLNVLVYLNRDWQESWGGSFEIWDNAVKTKFASFTPLFNRMVIFTTGSNTMHGNPEPVNHPQGDARRSIALYYYTATWDGARREHSTIFKGRPGTEDRSGFGQRVGRALDDMLPPYSESPAQEGAQENWHLVWLL